jgi:hypothetical protein
VNGTPRVVVNPDRANVRPGQSVGVDVTIQNTSKAVEHYGATIVGLPRDDLSSCEPAVVKLRPGESGSVRVSIAIPPRPAPLAGLYTLGVLVRSPYQRQVSRCEELRLTVETAPAVTLEVQPEVVHGGAEATYTVGVVNEGNAPTEVALHGSDQERKVVFAFRPRSVRIAANSSATVTLTVRARAPWSGQEARRALTLRATAQPDLVVERTATFVQRPRIPRGPVRVVGIAAAVAVLAGATIAGALVSRAKQDAARAIQPPPTSQPLSQPLSLPPVAPGVSTAPAGSTGPVPNPPAGTGPASPAGPGASSAASPAKPAFVDFGQLPDGQPAGDRIIQGDLYAASGVKLSTNVELAPPPCRTATGLALRTKAGVGSFLTSASPADAAACNTLPVKITFTAPAQSVRLVYVPNGTAYKMRVQLADGHLLDVVATAPAGALATLPYDAQAGARIVSVQFGHAGTDPADKNPTAVKQVAFTPAA